MARLLREAEQRAVAVLTGHRTALDRLSDLLLERETIDGADVDAILDQVGRASGNGDRVRHN